MAPPPKETIVAAISALRGDAETWRNNSGELDAATWFAADLSLTAADFSYLGERAGLPPVYQQLQEKVTVLLQEGARTFNSIAVALDQAANGYEHDEQYAVHEMLDKW